MTIKEIDEFAQIRPKARAYLCYLMSRAIPSRVPGITLKDIKIGLKSLAKTLPYIEAMYVLDKNGRQIINTISMNPTYARKGQGESRSSRAYYYKVIKDKKCILTDPYPSIESNKLVVTAAYPVFDEKGELLYIVCIDITLDNLLKMIHLSSIDSITGRVVKYVYAAFSLALVCVAFLLFLKGVLNFLSLGADFAHIEIKKVFESTILLTLSLAIFDLVKALFEEEVLGEHRKQHESDIHKTMVKFLGSIIIALSIEALMLVFKFALTDSGKLQYAVLLIGGITALLIGLSIYIKSLTKIK
ncbi:MAG: hypothetical protein GXN91_03535 [Epsilonproteobacteria bacterium]|nr:hypothetical protein [Campylobacterota bacterium]